MTAPEVNLPCVPSASPVPTARAEALLRSASLLLATGDQGDAVSALHAEIRRELGQPGIEGSLAAKSQLQAEEQHRQLSLQLSRQRARAKSGSRWQELVRRFPQWVSWSIVLAIVTGLMLRYSLALVDRSKWQHEHPDGPWLSRYYSDSDFRSFLLSRFDVAIDYDWGKKPPAQAMARDNWSARWDTCVITPAQQRIKLRLVADDAGRVFLDGKQQIRVRGRRPSSAEVTFSPGIHHLRVEYQERRRESKLKLQGLEFAGTEQYRFQRPLLQGDEVRCEPPPG